MRARKKILDMAFAAAFPLLGRGEVFNVLGDCGCRHPL
jgi:hypothetical protein